MAHACAALYFLNLKGDILIERRYRDDVARDMADNFRTQILNNKESSSVQCPVRTLGSVTFMYLKHNDIYLLMLAKNNANAMLAFKFMTSIVDLCRTYFQGALNENSVKRNFVLIYELLDECMDFGFPQLTEPAALKNFILEKGVRSEVDATNSAVAARDATMTVTGAVSWRRGDIMYKNNEIFVDIVEDVNMLMSSTGDVLKCDVTGRVLVKAMLSGMPELRLGLNECPEDITFHQCVNLSAWEAHKVVLFVPPDGESELMKYRMSEGIQVPFRVMPVIKELGRTRLEATVSIRSTFGPKLFALNCVFLIPVPEYTAKANISVTTGKAKYDPIRKALVWKVKRFSGQAEHQLRAEVTLVSTTKEHKPWGRPPISMQFQVPMHTASGVRVTYLKIMERRLGEYKVDRWMRKMTRSGDYLVRI